MRTRSVSTWGFLTKILSPAYDVHEACDGDGLSLSRENTRAARETRTER
jgi:hypothetical protein